MNAISFELSGKTAMFKKPDVNSYAYFTYNNIHKVALLGLLGSIIGLEGYTQLYNKKDDGFPEFYEKLKGLKISIIPLAPNGYFSKKIQVFNNGVGYASQEMGGNLIVREQWIENPYWQIIILDDNSEQYKKIKFSLLAKRSIFIPYLGKNDHPAKIDKVKEIDLRDKIDEADEIYMDSLFILDEDRLEGIERDDELPFVFKEFSPVALQKDFHFYEYKQLCFTNIELEKFPNDTYSYKDKFYAFI